MHNRMWHDFVNSNMLTGFFWFPMFFIFQIAHFKIPRYIKFVDEFPLTVTGKVRIWAGVGNMAAVKKSNQTTF